MIRHLALIRYPDGVSKEEGERWYLGTHTQEAKNLKGLCSYLTWKSEDSLERPRGQRWDRVTVLGFKELAAWREAQDAAPLWTHAPYGTRGFLAEPIFIPDSPQYDFLRDGSKLSDAGKPAR